MSCIIAHYQRFLQKNFVRILKNVRPRSNLLRKVYQAAEKLVYTWNYIIKQAHRSGKCSHKVEGVVINH